MIDLTRIIEGIEQLGYHALMWILFAPKTLIKIFLDPGWVSGYVTQEINSNKDTRFDGYLSPVILFFLVSLIPFAYAYITPYPDVTISGPTQAKVSDQVEFYASVDFIAETGLYEYRWAAVDNLDQYFKHDQTTDYVVFVWHDPGQKKVAVSVTNKKGESYHKEFYINIYDENAVIPVEETAQSKALSTRGLESEDIIMVLQSPVGFIAVLSFLSIPLLFALASESFRGYVLTQESLRRSFYIQCYFFAPFILTFWSLVLYSNYFVPPSESYVLLVPLFFAGFMVLWLIWCETNVIAQERSISILRAFIIVIFCSLIIALVAKILFFLPNPEFIRQLFGVIYMTIGVGLLLAWIIQMICHTKVMKGKIIKVIRKPQIN